MAHLGCGAEAYARFKQYEYRANSSVVLTTDFHLTHEPTGEPESLWGKIDPKSFSDHVYRGKPPELEKKLMKSKKKKEREPDEHGLLQKRDSKSFIQQQFGRQPHDLLSGAADEVLAVLKNDKFKNPDKKKEIEKLLNPISPQLFEQLVSVGRLITDSQDGGDAGSGGGTDGKALGDDIGVAVEFGEDGEEDESDFDQVQDEDGEGDDDGFDAGRSEAMQMGGIDDDNIEKADEGLNVQDIDAYWLQRMINDVCKEIDQQQSQKLAEKVLKILGEGDVGVVENKLVMLLGCDKFGLIKLLVRNRLKVVWCTKLARAEDHVERKSIEEEMMDGGPGLVAILEQLHATRATAKERQKNLEKGIREEAWRLKNESGDGDRERRVDRKGTTTMENSWLKGQRQLLDLDIIAFCQGSLLNSNKKCGLPEGSFRDPWKGYEEIHVPAPKPTLYGLPVDILDTDRTLEERRADLVTAFGI